MTKNSNPMAPHTAIVMTMVVLIGSGAATEVINSNES